MHVKPRTSSVKLTFTLPQHDNYLSAEKNQNKSKARKKKMRTKTKNNKNQNGARTLFFFFSCQVSVPYCGLSPMDPFPATLDSLRYCSAQGRTTGARDQCRDFPVVVVVAGKEGVVSYFLVVISFSYFNLYCFWHGIRWLSIFFTTYYYCSTSFSVCLLVPRAVSGIR